MMTLVVVQFLSCLLFYLTIFEDDRPEFRIAIFMKRESSGLASIFSYRQARHPHSSIYLERATSGK